MKRENNSKNMYKNIEFAHGSPNPCLWLPVCFGLIRVCCVLRCHVLVCPVEPPTAFSLCGHWCTVGVQAGTHQWALLCPGKMASGTKRQLCAVLVLRRRGLEDVCWLPWNVRRVQKFQIVFCWCETVWWHHFLFQIPTSVPTRLLSSLQGASLSQQHRRRCHKIQSPYRQYPQVPTVSLVPCPTLLNTVQTHITHDETQRVATKPNLPFRGRPFLPSTNTNKHKELWTPPFCDLQHFFGNQCRRRASSVHFGTCKLRGAKCWYDGLLEKTLGAKDELLKLQLSQTSTQHKDEATCPGCVRCNIQKFKHRKKSKKWVSKKRLKKNKQKGKRTNKLKHVCFFFFEKMKKVTRYFFW